MIVKMKFVNISGPRDDIDRITDLYLSRYEIQLESALSELKTVDNLKPFIEINPYRDALNKAIQFTGYLQYADEVEPDESLSLQEMFKVVRMANSDYMEMQDKKEALKIKIEELRNRQQIVAPFKPLDCELDEILHYKYIAYRFGRIPAEYYHKMEKYLLDDLDAIFVEGERDERYVYGAYFVSPGEAQKVDAVFRSLHFEKMELPSDLQGTPMDEYRMLVREIYDSGQEIEALDRKTGEMFSERAPQLIAARNRLEELANNFDVRKMAARMEDNKQDYYILCGWMADDDVEMFLEETRYDDKIFVVVEDDHSTYFGEPPTKLKNPKIFKPFEMFIRMYGLPSHNEMDPTIIVGLTYSLIFGIMFGDVGQGLLLFIGGSLIYHFRKAPLAGIIATAGIFSTIFGFMFGSIFGFEDIIQPLWLRPIDHMTTLPFIGKLNTVFIVSVAFGMVIILAAMILHIVNAIRFHDLENIWFDANGLAGFVFYLSVVITIVLFMTGHKTPGAVFMAVMFGIPLLLILFKEPITRKIQKRADAMEESAGMFLIQGFFELFETLLSYFSNTLSFVRIGAFAVSHAAIMEVVLILAGAENGSPNWVIIVLGNLFVCGFEGLIVGIQVLRLEYYEMFSRFYKGSGRAFDPYTNKSNKTKKK
ncbi:ATPase [Muricomes sp. OA1]|uniref:ATPase n=2 Tax=Lachnospiraceae TaxID=186803 RepID=A0A3E2WH98_9FIRM|nr:MULTISPECIES: V-type ATPase 116kDa subunit family protein [Clostridia]MCH1971979.1 ATPase [Muricomes sp. OA1]RGC26145.1 ATPase [Hungatella hathewayi]GKH30781.1 V-type ATP synthase subunit I [Faecalicatena contorta]